MARVETGADAPETGDDGHEMIDGVGAAGDGARAQAGGPVVEGTGAAETHQPRVKLTRAQARAVADGLPPVCMQWFHREEHDPAAAGCAHMLHCPLAERPPCVKYQRGMCAYRGEPGADDHHKKSKKPGDCAIARCWYPHRLVSRPMDANVAVQVDVHQVGRVRAWCEARGMAVVDVVRPRGGNRTAPRVIVGKAADATLLAREIASDPQLGLLAVSRVYRLGAEWRATVEEAAAVVAAAVARLTERARGGAGAKDGEAATRVRITGFPKQLERKLPGLMTEAIEGVGATLAPRDADVLVHVVQIHGCIYLHVEEIADGIGYGRLGEAGRAAHTVASRAYYKLREVVASGAVVLPRGREWTAMDVGASPGGWSQYLAEQGASAVYAIDPGLVELEHAAVEHVALLAGDAVPMLLERGLAGRVDVFVCDMNITPGECLALLRLALPLLRPGAPVVVTLKGSCCSQAEEEAVRRGAREAMSAALGGSEVTQVHCIANREGERTLIGHVPAGDH